MKEGTSVARGLLSKETSRTSNVVFNNDEKLQG